LNVRNEYFRALKRIGREPAGVPPERIIPVETLGEGEPKKEGAPGDVEKRVNSGKERAEARKRLTEGFEKYHKAVGADRYRVTSYTMNEDGKPAGRPWIIDRDKITKKSSGFLPDELRKKFSLFLKLAEGNDSLYFTPLSEKNHHVLIDDLDQEKLDRLIAEGYNPAYIQESSPGNFQALINLPKFEDATESENKEVMDKIFGWINKEFGDPKISGSRHPHRIPGTPNTKPKHRRPDGTYPLVKIHKAEPVNCSKLWGKARDILDNLRDEVDERRKRLAEVTRIKEATIRGIERDRAMVEAMEAKALRASPRETSRAYLAHMADIKAQFGVGINVFRADAMAVVRLRVTGHSREDIKDALRIFGRQLWANEGITREDDFEVYLENTVDRYGFGSRGDIEYSKYIHLMPRWMSVEGQEEERAAAAARMPVGPVPQVPGWILATQAERFLEGHSEWELFMAQKMSQVEKVGDLPADIPEIFVSKAMTIELPNGDMVYFPEDTQELSEEQVLDQGPDQPDLPKV
jgi:hypothetical protein